jgi:hypothetical protein
MKEKIRKFESGIGQRGAFRKCALSKCLLTVGILSVSLLVLVGCQESKENPVVPLEEQIVQTPEFRDLESIRKTVLKIIVQNRVTKHDYIRACAVEDAAAVADILGMEGGEWNSMTARMKDDVNSLMNRFPGLRKLGKAQEKPAGLESISPFLDRYDQIVEKLASAPDGLFKTDARVGCAYGQYSTCLVLAGYGAIATGGAAPLVYAGGAYLCLCSYCGGGWVDWVCF